MALIESLGWETLDWATVLSRGWALSSLDGIAPSITGGRYGGRALGYPTGGGIWLLTRDFPSGVAIATDLYFGQAIYFGEFTNGAHTPNKLFQALTASTGASLGDLRMDTGRNLLVYNRLGAQVGASLGLAPYNRWCFVEIHWHLGTTSSNGSIEVVLDGTVLGSRTSDFGGGTYSGARAYSAGNGLQAGTVDDFYVCDGTGARNNTYLGEVREIGAAPTGAGAHTDFTPSTGANWSCVDDVPPNGDTDYVSSLTVGAKDSYVFSDMPATVSQVLAVMMQLYARKDDAATRVIADLIRIGGVDYVGSNLGLAASYQQLAQVHELNPATGVAWTPSDVNGAEFGVTVIS